MSIVTFVDIIEPEARDEALELAIAVAEFCNEERELLYLTCDAATALEIGVSLLGSRQARTVEGGVYFPSTLRLLSTIPRPGSAADELAGGADDEIGGGLEELYQLGLFARPEERGPPGDFVADPATALEEAIATLAPSHVIGLGKESAFWTSVARGLERAASVSILVEIEGFAPTELRGRFERVPLDFRDVLMGTEREAETEVGDFVEVQQRAERMGVLVGRLFEQLGRPGSAPRAEPMAR